MSIEPGEPVRWDGVDLETIRRLFANGSSTQMSEAAATLADIKRLLDDAVAAVGLGLDGLIDNARGSAAGIGARHIAQLRVLVRALADHVPDVESAASTTAQGADLVRAKIDELPPAPVPPPYHQQDVTLSWLDGSPYEDAEQAYRGGAEDVRAALAAYQTDTTAALLALPQFRTSRDEPEQNGPGTSSAGPLPGGGPVGRRVDSLSDTPTLPMRARSLPPPPQTGGAPGFGPTGHADEDRALANAGSTSPVEEEAADTAPVQRYRRADRSYWEPDWTPIRQNPSDGNSFFDPDTPTVGPVIGE